MRAQNADGSVEVQPDEEPWDESASPTSSSDVSPTGPPSQHVRSICMREWPAACQNV